MFVINMHEVAKLSLIRELEDLLPMAHQAKKCVNSDYFSIFHKFPVLFSSFPIEKKVIHLSKLDQYIDKYVYYNPPV